MEIYHIVNIFIMQPLRHLCPSVAGKIKSQELSTGHLKGWVCLMSITRDAPTLSRTAFRLRCPRDLRCLPSKMGDNALAQPLLKILTTNMEHQQIVWAMERVDQWLIMFTKLIRAINFFDMY